MHACIERERDYIEKERYNYIYIYIHTYVSLYYTIVFGRGEVPAGRGRRLAGGQRHINGVVSKNEKYAGARGCFCICVYMYVYTYIYIYIYIYA